MLFGKKASDLKPESKPVALTDDHKATQKATKDGKQLELDKDFTNGKWTIEQGETIDSKLLSWNMEYLQKQLKN